MSLKKIARFPEGPSTSTPGLCPWRFSGKASVASAPPRKSVCVSARELPWGCGSDSKAQETTKPDEVQGGGSDRDQELLVTLTGCSSELRPPPGGLPGALRSSPLDRPAT